MRRRVLSVAAVAAALLAGGIPAPPAAAGLITIEPLDLRSLGAPSEGVRTPGGVSGSGPAEACRYWFPLRLPVGSRIRRIVYYHRGAAGQVSTASVVLLRARFGEMAEQLAVGSVTDGSGVVLEREVNLAAPVRVRRGYRHWLTVGESNWYGTFLGAKVSYR